MFDHLRLPLICAPMFLVSDPQLVIAACKSGIVGCTPTLNTRNTEELRQWLETIEAERKATLAAGQVFAPYGINIVLHTTARDRNIADLDLCEEYAVPLIATSVGDPASVVERVHQWGGKVIHDAITLRHARKAAAAGVDGIVLVCAGAGGHGGHLNPFSFLPLVRAFYDGTLILAGGIGTGAGMRAAQVLGADYIYMGTRFIGTREAQVSPHYKEQLLSSEPDDIIMTSALSGIPANYMHASLLEAGIDIETLPQGRVIQKLPLPEGKTPWRDIWSAGHGVGLIDDLPSIEDLVQRLEQEYQLAK